MRNRLLLIFGVYLPLLAGAALTLLPFAWMASASVKSGSDFFSSLFLPAGDGWLGVAWDRLTLDHFRQLFSGMGIARSLLNSFFLSSVSALGATFASALGGYALAKLHFRGAKAAGYLVLGAIVLPSSLLLAPGYQVIYQLGLLDTYAGLLLPAIAPAFGVFLFRQAALYAVPDELIESARIDGAGEFKIFFAIALPLLRPMIGAFLLITFLGCWNNFIGPQIILQSPERFPLSVAIAQLKGVYGHDYGLIMAGTLVSVAPVMLLFLLLQKEFIQGLTAGAVKS